MEEIAADKEQRSPGKKRMEPMEHGLVPHTPELCQHMRLVLKHKHKHSTSLDAALPEAHSYLPVSLGQERLA